MVIGEPHQRLVEHGKHHRIRRRRMLGPLPARRDRLDQSTMVGRALGGQELPTIIRIFYLIHRQLGDADLGSISSEAYRRDLARYIYQCGLWRWITTTWDRLDFSK